MVRIIPFLLVFLMGCAIPIKVISIVPKISMKEEKKIIDTFEAREERLILLSFYKVGLDMFGIASELKVYKKVSKEICLDGFIKWLRQRYPFSEIADWWIDKYVFNVVKDNYKLLDDIYDERDNIELYRNDLIDKEKDE